MSLNQKGLEVNQPENPNIKYKNTKNGKFQSDDRSRSAVKKNRTKQDKAARKQKMKLVNPQKTN
jgi:hypothetical protein